MIAKNIEICFNFTRTPIDFPSHRLFQWNASRAWIFGKNLPPSDSPIGAERIVSLSDANINIETFVIQLTFPINYGGTDDGKAFVALLEAIMAMN